MKTTKNPHYAVKLFFVIVILAIGYFSKSYLKKESTNATQPKYANSGIALH